MSSRSLICRVLLVPALVVLGIGGAFAASPAWARSVGLDVWNASELAEQEQEAVERKAELAAEDAEICQRIGLKEAVIDDLVAGRTTLAEATARFTDLNQSQPNYMTMIHLGYPGSTDEEKMARNVMGYALARAEEPAECERLAHRLDAELRTMLDGHAAE